VGTNYYFKKEKFDGLCCERVHIGKSVASGEGNPNFIMDIPIEKLDDLKFIVENGTRIVDEYGREYSLKKFKEFLSKRILDNRYIGRGFS
jgi:hypothetical protein